MCVLLQPPTNPRAYRVVLVGEIEHQTVFLGWKDAQPTAQHLQHTTPHHGTAHVYRHVLNAIAAGAQLQTQRPGHAKGGRAGVRQ